MKNIIGLILLVIFTSCATVKVREQGEYYVKVKPLKPVYPVKTEKRFISGKYVNPEVWIDKKGRYFYYTEHVGFYRRKKIKLKVLK